MHDLLALARQFGLTRHQLEVASRARTEWKLGPFFAVAHAIGLKKKDVKRLERSFATNAQMIQLIEDYRSGDRNALGVLLKRLRSPSADGIDAPMRVSSARRKKTHLSHKKIIVVGSGPLSAQHDKESDFPTTRWIP
jgi:hypothetical protein